MIRIFICCFLSIAFFCSGIHQAYAFAPNNYSSKVPDLLGSVLKKRISNADLSVATGSAVSGVLAGAASSVAFGAVVGTPVGWAAVLGTVLLEAGVSGAVGVAAGGLYSWLFSSDGKVQVLAAPVPAEGHFMYGSFICASAEACVYAQYAQPVIAESSGAPSSVTCYWEFIGGPAMSVTPPASLCGDGSGCSGNAELPWNCSVKGSYKNGNSWQTVVSGYWYATGKALNGKLVTRTDGYTGGTFGPSDVPSDIPLGDTLNGYLSGPEIDLGHAETEIPDSVATEALDPDLLANALNAAWQKAAAQPGYNGEPYDATNPVTGDEVSQVAQETGGMPTVGDFISPVVDGDNGLVQAGSSGTGSFAGSIVLPVAAAAAAGTGTGSGSPSGTGTGGVVSPNLSCGLPGTPACEVDWGSTGGGPSDPTAPTMSSILSPVFNLFPGLRHWVAPVHSSTCPTPSFSFFGSQVSFSPVCSMLSQYSGTIGNASVLGATFLSAIILLGA